MIYYVVVDRPKPQAIVLSRVALLHACLSSIFGKELHQEAEIVMALYCLVIELPAACLQMHAH